MMYESSFGLTGLPFRLAPDPAFFYEGGGYRDALDKLQHRIEAGERLLIVSGQIGAGKTLLLRALLQGLDERSISTVYVAGAQMGAESLMESLAIALGMTGEQAGQSVSTLVIRLQSNRLPTLIAIDEAQHLTLDALYLLESLLECTAKAGAPLQIVLAGQPELRATLDAAELSRFKSRIDVLLELGPLGRIETKDYIEHRLRQVGWRGQPQFESDTFDRVYKWTGGVPRRVNVLCNRMMLAAFVGDQASIDGMLVESAACDLSSELGPVPVSPSTEVSARAATPVSGSTAVSATQPGVPVSMVPRSVNGSAMIDPGSILCVAGGLGDHIQMAALMRGLHLRDNLPPVRLVRALLNPALALNRDLFPAQSANCPPPHSLGVNEWPFEHRLTEVAARFATLVAARRPSAVIVCNGSSIALACARVARANSVPVVHLDAGRRLASISGEDAGIELDRIGDLHFCGSAECRRVLLQEGVPADRIHDVGTLSIDAVQYALRTVGDRAEGLLQRLVPPDFLADRRGFGLIGLSAGYGATDRQGWQQLLKLLASVSRDLPLVWPLGASTWRMNEALKLSRILSGERIACVPSQPHVAMIELMRQATCVVTNAARIQEEAAALGVPCLCIGPLRERVDHDLGQANILIGHNSAAATRAIWDIAYNGRRPARLPPSWTGAAGERMAARLEALVIRQSVRKADH